MAFSPRFAKPRTVNPVFVITADRVVKQSENFATFIIDVNTTTNLTLPAPFKGANFTFFIRTAAASGVGHTIKVASSSDKLYSKTSPTGAAIAESGGKGVTNTQATGVKGDTINVVSDGTHWHAVDLSGTWAREA